jgi:hypothetical protein
MVVSVLSNCVSLLRFKKTLKLISTKPISDISSLLSRTYEVQKTIPDLIIWDKRCAISIARGRKIE